MPAFTENLNLYLPGGGSLGIGGADENADIDKLNQNFQKIDDWSEEVDGRTVIATNEDIDAGTSTTKLVTVSGLKRGSPYLGMMTKTSGNTVTSGSAEVAISGSSLVVTVPRAGRVRLLGGLVTFSSVIGDVVVIRIKEGGTVRGEFTVAANSSGSQAGTSQYQNFQIVLSGVTAGAHTYTLAVARAAGTGVITVVPSSIAPVQLSAEMMD